MPGKRAKATEIYPHQIIRQKDGPAYFGFGHAQLDAKIASGEVPAPIPLSATGRAKGWTGQMIMDHHAELQKLAAKRAAEAKAEALAVEAVAKSQKSKPKLTRAD
jgi:hypothetical protein